ncbi:hypothetical protein [uncultured Sphingomonas sp.]|uniref:hypothetical protein n=1 Tax=uncultured Sphingomonas sp. TaxID=158754 RepID=UPI002616F13F|nr:hypothetical protein [uncultured Sphingomonas sp.]
MVMIAGCGQVADPSSAEIVQIDKNGAMELLTTAQVEAAKAAVLKEPWATDVHFRENQFVREWQVTRVGADQSEFGRAEFVCMTLADAGVRDDRTEVWILDDQAARNAGGVDVIQKAGRGGVRCATGAHMTG